MLSSPSDCPMSDIVLDTNVIGDFLAQYFAPAGANRGAGEFRPEGKLTRALIARLNRILDTFRRYDLGETLNSPYAGGLIVSSAFAFVELCRNWDRIVQKRFSIIQLEGFLLQPPDWFSIAPVDEVLLPFYANIPSHITLRGEIKPIEWCDAIHAATADSRGRSCLLATTDERLQAITHFRNRIAM
jgi:predicted nucleic acid-binding protein